MAETRGDDDGIRDVETSNRAESGKTRRNPSLNSLAIARTASKPAGVSSMDAMELVSGLYKGVLLDEDKVKFWVDEKLNKNCFMLLAKAFHLSNYGNPYWIWLPDQVDCFGGLVEVEGAIAKNNYRWSLEVMRELPSILLSPMTTYEVVYVLKMSQDSNGWDGTTEFSLRLPNRPLQSRMEVLGKKPREEWIEVLAGKFVATSDIVGYIRVSLKDINFAYKKEGMFVKGVLFRPLD